LDRCSRAQVASLEARRDSRSGNIGEYGSLLVRAHLVDAIDGFGEQERLVATFYFYEGLTLKEIGKVMNLTEGSISQILKRARAKGRFAPVGGK
jgi:RNA polymerase sigma factor (sigma-70 family)